VSVRDTFGVEAEGEETDRRGERRETSTSAVGQGPVVGEVDGVSRDEEGMVCKVAVDGRRSCFSSCFERCRRGYRGVVEARWW
jgi:hypothetical protein